MEIFVAYLFSLFFSAAAAATGYCTMAMLYSIWHEKELPPRTKEE